MKNAALNSNLVIGLVQMSMTKDPSENLEKAILGIKDAASRGSDIVCLPELFRSPYFCVTKNCNYNYAEEPRALNESLSAVAKECGVVLIAGSIYEKIEGNSLGYNTSYVFNHDGQLIGNYRKTHIPHDPSFYEQDYFISGGENYRLFETEIRGQFVKIGVLICYDQWFPEAARALALMGADIIFYPTAIGTVSNVYEREGNWQHAWKTVQMGHAVANSTIVCPVNRVGQEGDSHFWGGSFVCDAFGRILSEGSNREEIITATVDLSHNQWIKDSWRFFKERRPETYGLISK